MKCIWCENHSTKGSDTCDRCWALWYQIHKNTEIAEAIIAWIKAKKALKTGQ